MSDRLLTLAEVADLFRVTNKTITRWSKVGLLHPIRTAGGHRRYRDSEVRALIDSSRNKYNGPAERALHDA